MTSKAPETSPVEQVGSVNFKKWFEGSLIKDSNGNPLVIGQSSPTPQFSDSINRAENGELAASSVGLLTTIETGRKLKLIIPKS